MDMNQMEECKKNCIECYETCAKTMAHCIETGGKHAEKKHIILLRDCAKICSTSADFMIHNSPYHKDVCGVCAKICDDCAKDCESFSEEFMKKCAEVCKRCADSCRKMSD